MNVVKVLHRYKIYSRTTTVVGGLDNIQWAIETESGRTVKFVSLCSMWLGFIGKGDNIFVCSQRACSVHLFSCPFPGCRNRLSRCVMIWHRHHSSSWDIAGGNNKPVSLAHVKEFRAWGVKSHRLPCGSAYAWTVITAITLIIKMPQQREWRGSRGRKRQKSDGRRAGIVRKKNKLQIMCFVWQVYRPVVRFHRGACNMHMHKHTLQ